MTKMVFDSSDVEKSEEGVALIGPQPVTNRRDNNNLTWRLATIFASLVFGGLFFTYYLDNSIQPHEHSGLDLEGQNTTSILKDVFEQAPACSQIGQAELDKLRENQELSVHAFSNGEPLVASEPADAGQSVCFVVAVPQRHAVRYTDRPISGKGPDDIHLFVSTSGVSIDFLPLLPLQPEVDLVAYESACMERFSTREEQYECFKSFYGGQADNGTTILYAAETILLHSGKYKMAAEVEYEHYKWAHEYIDNYFDNIVHYPTGLDRTFSDRDYRMIELKQVQHFTTRNVLAQSFYPRSIQVRESKPLQEAWKNRPFCDSTHSPSSGRWYSRQFFEHYPPEVYDDWGYVWDGDTCQIDFYTSEDMFRCLEDKNVFVYGDSNMRRMMRSLMSGNTYCMNETAQCQINESEEPSRTLKYDDDAGGLVVEWQGPGVSYGEGGTPDRNWQFMERHFGYNSRDYFAMTKTLTYQYSDWTRRLYDYEDHPEDQRDIEGNASIPLSDEVHLFRPDKDLRKGARARHHPDYPAADLVIVGAPYWDQGFDYHFEDYESTMPHYRDAILEAYPDTPIALQLSQGFCCRRDRTDYRRFSGMRNRHFQDVMVEHFEPEMQSGHVSLLDPRLLTGRPEVVREGPHEAAGHVIFSQIRLEVQMLLNNICERPEGPGVKSSVPRLRTSWPGLKNKSKNKTSKPSS